MGCVHGRRGAVSAEIRRLAHRAPRAALGHTPDPRWLPPVFQWELVHVGGEGVEMKRGAGEKILEVPKVEDSRNL